MQDYAILARDWDALNPKEQIYKQKDFFAGLIQKYFVQSCLDCACGTGWHLYMLKELGLECYGSDLSAEMIEAAKDNTKGTGIQLKQEDYRYLSNSWDKKLDMIICMSNSIRHMLDEADTVAAFQSMHAQLNPGGILLIDNGVSDKMIDARPKLLPGRIHNDQAFYFILEYPKEKEIVFNILQVKYNNGLEHSFESLRLSAMKKSDYEKCLINAGFKNIEFYAGYDLSEFNAQDSDRMIAVAQK